MWFSQTSLQVSRANSCSTWTLVEHLSHMNPCIQFAQIWRCASFSPESQVLQLQIAVQIWRCASLYFTSYGVWHFWHSLKLWPLGSPLHSKSFCRSYQDVVLFYKYFLSMTSKNLESALRTNIKMCHLA